MKPIAIIIPCVLGSVLLTAGGVIFAIGVAKANQATPVVENEHIINEAFTNFNIDVGDADIEFKVAEDGKNKVIAKETEKNYYTVEVKEGTLNINHVDERKWYEKIFNFTTWLSDIRATIYLTDINFDTLAVNGSTGNLKVSDAFTFDDATIKMSTGRVDFSAKVNEDLSIETSTGDIYMVGTTAKNLSLTQSTGKAYLEDVVVTENIVTSCSTGDETFKNVTAKNLTVTGSNSKISLTNVIMSQKISIVVRTGDVHLEDCDAGELYLRASTGDITGTLLTSKIFIVRTSTGHIDVPKTTTGGVCDVETSTGNIIFSIKA